MVRFKQLKFWTLYMLEYHNICIPILNAFPIVALRTSAINSSQAVVERIFSFDTEMKRGQQQTLSKNTLIQARLAYKIAENVTDSDLPSNLITEVH